MNPAEFDAILFDMGGVLTTSPFENFAAYEARAGLPADFIRLVNSTDPDSNAWSLLERGELDAGGFVVAFEAEGSALRVSEAEELGGLDIGEHGMEAYSGFQIFSTQ